MSNSIIFTPAQVLLILLDVVIKSKFFGYSKSNTSFVNPKIFDLGLPII